MTGGGAVSTMPVAPPFDACVRRRRECHSLIPGWLQLPVHAMRQSVAFDLDLGHSQAAPTRWHHRRDPYRPGIQVGHVIKGFSVCCSYNPALPVRNGKALAEASPVIDAHVKTVGLGRNKVVPHEEMNGAVLFIVPTCNSAHS